MSIDRFMERWLKLLAWVPVGIVCVFTPLILWWALEPSPLKIEDVATYFTDRPVESMEEAQKHAVQAISGGSVVYRFVQYCVRRPFQGTAHRSWVNSAMVWHAPDVPTQLSRDEGCRHANIAVEVPTSNPTRSFFFVQKMEIYVNPLRAREIIDYPPIPLTILK